MFITARSHIRRIKRWMLRRLHLWTPPASATLTIRPDDAFLVSYPRSGNTWLRFLLAHLIHRRPLNFRELELVISDIYQNSDRELLSLRPPRIMKSHEFYNPEYPKIVYLIRDPRDVAISFYYWRKKQKFFERPGAEMTLQEYLLAFPEQECAFSNWGEHVESWLSQADELGDRLLFVKYEDMKKNPNEALCIVADYIGVEYNELAIENAVRLSSIENIRKAERTVYKNKGKDAIPFAHKGTAGQWEEVFSEDLNSKYIQRFSTFMEHFGYLSD